MTPNTTVTLYATPFDITNKYVIKADSEQEALAIVSAYPSTSFTNCYWQRTDDFVFRCNGNINDIEQYNYCVFLNNGKYNFAFITKCQYVNDAMTWVYLTIDPWLNFAGKYTFKDSPLRRGHTDALSIYNIDFVDEPIEVRPAVSAKVSHGDLIENDDVRFLVTSLKTATIPDATAIADYWNGVSDVINNANTQQIISWSQQIQAGDSLVGSAIQGNTCIANGQQINQIVSAFLQNGLNNAIIGCYYVPTTIYTHQGTVIDSPVTTPIPMEIHEALLPTLIPHSFIPTYWPKIQIAPQFRQIFVNCGGNVKEIPAVAVLNELGYKVDIPFEVIVDPNINGGFSARLKRPYHAPDVRFMAPDDELTCFSPGWDTIPIQGYGIDIAKTRQTISNDVATVTSGIFGLGANIAGAMFSAAMYNGVGISNGLFGALGDITGMNTGVTSNALNYQSMVENSSFKLGSNTGTLAHYNTTSPLFQCWITAPDNLREIAIMFGTYGYTYNSSIPRSITFGDYPYWKYFECAEVNIEGDRVPQKYLAQVIAMFKNGVFVFNDTEHYKDFSLAYQNHLNL